jgi:hypothetical protein
MLGSVLIVWMNAGAAWNSAVPVFDLPYGESP